VVVIQNKSQTLTCIGVSATSVREYTFNVYFRLKNAFLRFFEQTYQKVVIKSYFSILQNEFTILLSDQDNKFQLFRVQLAAPSVTNANAVVYSYGYTLLSRVGR